MDQNDERLEEEEIEATDETAEEESFAELLQESFVKPVRFSPGQKVKTKVAKISSEWIFLDLGAKSEGYLDRKEVLDDEGNLTIQEGDAIEAYFLSSDNNELRFTTRISGGEAGRHFLEDAWHNGIPVEGVVEREIKGGFEIKIAGGLRGFCPYSQMGLHRSASPEDLAGKHLFFKITQYAEKGRNIVLSNRAVLEEELRRQKAELRKTLQEGMKVRGTVSSIQGFGAFVNIGCVDGLIPISEISWDRVEDIHGHLEVGQEVEVVVVSLDWEKERFSFSLKRALPDPWENVEKDFPEGSVHKGTIVRLANFGAFVSLGSGVDGLLHISRLGAQKRISHPREVVSNGQVVEVKIDSIDKENKRLSLSMAASEQVEEKKRREEDVSQYVGRKSESMGTFGDLLRKAEDTKKKKK